MWYWYIPGKGFFLKKEHWAIAIDRSMLLGYILPNSNESTNKFDSSNFWDSRSLFLQLSQLNSTFELRNRAWVEVMWLFPWIWLVPRQREGERGTNTSTSTRSRWNSTCRQFLKVAEDQLCHRGKDLIGYPHNTLLSSFCEAGGINSNALLQNVSCLNFLKREERWVAPGARCSPAFWTWDSVTLRWSAHCKPPTIRSWPRIFLTL